ncbi:Pentatricopeptide repeat-containing protein [Abeliophyllum distichum]|uniref:Pentatricopeptide repeat-containing protein n=1 Tax=Abeliophyllum distichum TaxID=126358 RepID=A0ABD1Q4C4_9LAMI
MSIQKFIQNLKTVKGNQIQTPYINPKSKIGDTIITKILISSNSQPIPIALLSKLTPRLVHLILSDPHLKLPKCLDFFNFLLKNQSLINFKLNLESHFILICRLVKQRKFTDAERLLGFFSNDENLRYPFPVIASCIRNRCGESRIPTKIFNMMLKVYSDSQRFKQVVDTFNYMESNGIQINEKTCTVILIELIKCDQLELGLELFYRMLDSGIEVSVFSLTVVVDGLCKNGEINRAMELVEEMVTRGLKPNIITCNIMVNASTKRWKFEELKKILDLMKRVGVDLNVETFKFLVDGFSSCGKIEEADKVVLEMHQKGFIVGAHLYNLVINGYCRLGNVERAFALFGKMKEENICPNIDTYGILASHVSKMGGLVTAKEFIKEMQTKLNELEVVLV